MSRTVSECRERLSRPSGARPDPTERARRTERRLDGKGPAVGSCLILSPHIPSLLHSPLRVSLRDGKGYEGYEETTEPRK